MKHQHRALGMLSLLSISIYLGRVCIAVAGPRMQDALQIFPGQMDRQRTHARTEFERA